MTMKIEKPLTEVELQLMNVIWALNECTVKEVQTELSKDRELAYTSVATVMKILESKGILKSAKSDKAHVYTSLISKESYEKQSLEHLAENLFKGDSSMMVMRLLDNSNLSQKDLQAIREVLNSRLSK
ncbi:MAG: BlaI/MecI/CopY family transcriptional regulator [Bdellovibrionales bacterium]|nr:BlaI/MecI/CopY family transcriptional regulator [Bdellovibrionales bacterium]